MNKIFESAREKLNSDGETISKIQEIFEALGAKRFSVAVSAWPIMIGEHLNDLEFRLLVKDNSFDMSTLMNKWEVVFIGTNPEGLEVFIREKSSC